MLQMVRLGDQYLNLAHVLSVWFGVDQWKDDKGAHGVALAIVEMAVSAGAGTAGCDSPTTYRFYGATAMTLRAWLDQRTTVIAEEAERCPRPVWNPAPADPLDADIPF